MILFEGDIRALMRKSQNVLHVFNSSLRVFQRNTNRFIPLLLSVVRSCVRVGGGAEINLFQPMWNHVNSIMYFKGCESLVDVCCFFVRFQPCVIIASGIDQ
jgi:hypothetical protein